MGRTLDEKIATLPEARRVRVAARAEELIAEEMSLRDLRKAMDLTQTRMAERLGTSQDSVSRVEKRADMLLSTLREYVEAMGGELVLTARFPGRPPVYLRDLGALTSRRGGRVAPREGGPHSQLAECRSRTSRNSDP